MCRDRFDTLLVNRESARTLTAINDAAYEVHWLAGGEPALLRGDVVGV